MSAPVRSDTATGKMNPAAPTTNIPTMSVDGVSLGSVDINFGANGVTQFADSSGTVSVGGTFDQDGFAAGALQGISVDSKGQIVGAYSNGRNLALAQVSLASFNGQNSLKRLDGGAFAETGDSGPPNYSSSATISASSLEASNADIGDEFTKLIVHAAGLFGQHQSHHHRQPDGAGPPEHAAGDDRRSRSCQKGSSA